MNGSITVICNSVNRITRVIEDELALGWQPDAAFALAFDVGSRDKAVRFLEAVRRDGAARDWELNAWHQGRQRLLYLAGNRLSDGNALVAGAETAAAASQAHRSLLALGAGGETAADSVSGRRSILEELSAVNNELVNAQRELAKTNAELERAMEEKEGFVAMAAHDLRSPLNVILNAGCLLADGPGAAAFDSQQRELLSIISRNSRRMLLMLDDVVFVFSARHAKLDRSRTDLAELLRANVSSNRPVLAQKGIALEFECAQPAPPEVEVDPGRIEQVLDNLIHNAMKFSAPGSTVRVKLSAAGASVRIAVSDQGRGIPLAERGAIFKPFYSVGPGTSGESGSGLGLASVLRIVEAHGGRVTLESAAGAGSTFYIELPAAGRRGSIASDHGPAGP